ncbi:MAG: FAD-dependent oxidoreductase [Rhizobiales bacterium]|nr:FAD-dependent oxidoreductase [Hyphomicrobiales bacterium]
MREMTTPGDTIVIGAGVVGTSTALELARRGRRVVLIDRDEPGMGCSYGNLAGIAITQIMPQATPSTLRNIPGWLLDPLGPVTLRWRDLPFLAPWLWRFVLSANRRQVEATTDANATLQLRAASDTEALLQSLGKRHMLGDRDCLAICTTEAEIVAARPDLALKARYGLPCQPLTGNEMRELEPELSPAIPGGWAYTGWRHVSSPIAMTRAMVEALRQQGGTVRRARVTGFGMDGARVSNVALDGEPAVPAGEVVIAAGAWSATLAAMLGDRIPLVAERGYHTLFERSGVNLRHGLLVPAHGFGITQCEDGLRVGGSDELSHPDGAPNFRRAKPLVEKARRLLPNLDASDGREWSGCRPATPDTRPVIGRASRVPNVHYAFGHGHLGLTMAATTARLLSESMTGAPMNFDLAPFRPDRF